MTSFLIVHGWQNRRPPAHWQHWLAHQLTAHGHEVCYPQLPDPDEPSADAWAAAIRRHLAAMRDPARVVVCHSLGCMAWLRLAASRQKLPAVDRLLFVAPPSRSYLAAEPALAGFQPPRAYERLLAATVRGRPRLVCSDNDQCCPEGADRAYPTGFDIDMITEAGHFDVPAGYGSWPSILAWCEDPAARVTARPDSPEAGQDLADNRRIMIGPALQRLDVP